MLADIVKRMTDTRILVIGDAMWDKYIFGKVEKISPEGPVPIFIPREFDTRPGGAGNTAHQLRALVGGGLGGGSVDTSFPGLRSIKTRYMVGSHLMLRVDEDQFENPAKEDVAAVVERVASYDAVVLSDYAKGWAAGMAREVIKAALAVKVPVVVDPKGSCWYKYDGAFVVCPNQEEYESWDRCRPRDFALIEKRGEHGLRLRTLNGQRDFPAKAKHVYDVTGAGDTVVAVVAATLAAGGTIEQACELANLAAGYVVGEIGTVACPAFELLRLANEHDRSA